MNNSNNFDLLRFAFAFVVFLVHAQTLSRNSTMEPLASLLSSELAINGFFVISGYLVYSSHNNSRSTVEYFQKRVRRIYPAYLTVVCLCATLGVTISSSSIPDYFGSVDFAKYMAANLIFCNFIAPDLPGVFENNPLRAVNGALWTLKIEVMFYISVPLIAYGVRRFGHAKILSILYVLSVIYRLSLDQLHSTTGGQLYQLLARQLPGQLTYFVAGMALYHWRAALPGLRIAVIPSTLFLLFVDDPVLRVIAEPAAIGLVVICAAVATPSAGNFGRFGDLSYGLYIWHFPILQGLIALQLFSQTGWLGFWIATALVIPTAFLSWHLIEKRWLQGASHYIVATGRT